MRWASFDLLHAQGRLPVQASAFAIEDVARLVGVANQYEFRSEDGCGNVNHHFADEVLVFPSWATFPWRLLTATEWAAAQDDEPPHFDGFD